jgi:hypothetical protein
MHKGKKERSGDERRAEKRDDFTYGFLYEQNPSFSFMGVVGKK